MPPPDIVRDRQAMASLLSDRMIGSYQALAEEQRLGTETSLVKSYLVESTIREDNSDPSVTEDAANALLAPFAPMRRVDLTIHRSDDATLLNLEALVEINRRHERVVIYVDLSNPRFWLLHSMGGSSAVDYLIDRLVSSGPDLDRAWLPADFLEQVANLGSFRGLNLDYDRRPIPDVDFASVGAPPEFLKMQLWGSRAAQILEILRAESAFPHETTLAKVKVKYSLDRDVPGDFTLDDVKYTGKVTARGTSFDSHLALLSDIYSRYSRAVNTVENHHRIVSRETGGFQLTGDPIHFWFQPPIANLGLFCEHVFSASEPFRLWGVPVRLKHDYVRVEAVDLHVGHTMRFEITPEFMRVYLPSGACGNSVIRLYTNLQHHYDSRVQVLANESEPVFTFQQNPA